MTTSRAHRPHLRARDVHPIPYLGAPEDRLRASFLNAYADVRSHLRGPDFDTISSFSMDHVDNLMESARQQFHEAALPTYAKVVGGGAALGHVDAIPVATPLSKAAVDVEVQRPRRSYLNRRGAFAGPRLHGLRRSPVPVPSHSFPAPERHRQAAAQLSLNMVSSVNQGQRAEIRKVLSDSFTRGINPRDTAVRISNIVGLFPRWQKAVNNLYARMLDNDVPQAIADRRVMEYADGLLQKRSVMIARTELMRAMNTGRWAGWHDLADQGLLDPQRTEKTWSGTLDHAICPECEYLADAEGKGKGLTVVGIDTPFQTEYGPVIMPPCHPHCRCGAVIKIVQIGRADLSADDLTRLADPEISDLIDVMG